VEWFNTDIRPIDAAFQKVPKLLRPFRVRLAVNVLYVVLDNSMRVFSGQTVIGKQRTGVERGSGLNMLFDLSLKCFLLTVRTIVALTLPPRSKIPVTAVLSFGSVPVIRRLRSEAGIFALFRR
jgi:hypothetical protein